MNEADGRLRPHAPSPRRATLPCWRSTPDGRTSSGASWVLGTPNESMSTSTDSVASPSDVDPAATVLAAAAFDGRAEILSLGIGMTERSSEPISMGSSSTLLPKLDDNSSQRTMAFGIMNQYLYSFSRQGQQRRMARRAEFEHHLRRPAQGVAGGGPNVTSATFFDTQTPVRRPRLYWTNGGTTTGSVQTTRAGSQSATEPILDSRAEPHEPHVHRGQRGLCLLGGG